MIRSLTAAVVLYTLVAGLTVFWVYRTALNSEFDATVRAGDIRLSEATARLQGQFEALRIMVNLIAQDRLLTKALETTPDSSIDEILKLYSLKYGPKQIDLVDRTGRVVASSSTGQIAKPAEKPLVEAAMNGRLGYQIWHGEDQRLVRFSRGVLDPARHPIGAIVVTADLANLEFEWPVTPEPYVFFNDDGVSISSNRPDLLLLSRAGGQGTPTFPVTHQRRLVGHNLWTYHSGRDLPQEVLSLTRRIGPLRMDSLILLDTSAARSTALLRMWLAFALFIVLFLAAAIAFQQRRRLAIETQHSATLETRVQERTAELRTAQDKLVESSKLAAMGRLSAGLSHELNQPLAAIMNFSENGKRFIEKEKIDRAEQNFGMISDQVRRMTRIISGLRAFARQEAAPTDILDLGDITKEAIEMARDDLTKNGITLKDNMPDMPVLVAAGRVRLQQVILNLISNAVDAMHSAQTKVLSVSMIRDARQVRLVLGDTGDGIQDLDRVFEPFYTTKDLGASKGLGMGLALSYGIISRFGGELSCQNTAQGAEFTITLPLSEGDV